MERPTPSAELSWRRERLCTSLETFDAAGRIHQLLFAGEERVAGGADFHADVALVRGFGLERSDRTRRSR